MFLTPDNTVLQLAGTRASWLTVKSMSVISVTSTTGGLMPALLRVSLPCVELDQKVLWVGGSVGWVFGVWKYILYLILFFLFSTFGFLGLNKDEDDIKEL